MWPMLWPKLGTVVSMQRKERWWKDRVQKKWLWPDCPGTERTVGASQKETLSLTSLFQARIFVPLNIFLCVIYFIYYKKLCINSLFKCVALTQHLRVHIIYGWICVFHPLSVGKDNIPSTKASIPPLSSRPGLRMIRKCGQNSILLITELLGWKRLWDD